MQTTESWAWYPGTLWPGFSIRNQNNIGPNGDGLAIDPASLTLITFNDANGDGIISDDDTGDGSRANGDTITVGGRDRTVHEVGQFLSSTFVHNGTTYTVPMIVWVFTDGTYMVRINDSDIPRGHWSRTERLQLGRWDGREYSGTVIGTRDAGFFCFAAGTRIATPAGPRAVETLGPGALVETLDHGPQPLRWTGQRRAAGLGDAAPVRFAAGALGNTRPLVVSPNHRMLLTDPRLPLFFGLDQAFAAAAHLVDGVLVTRAPVAAVTWVHLLFDRHEIVLAEGAWAESLHAGPAVRDAAEAALQAEIAALFPGPGGPLAAPLARPCLRRFEAALLLPRPAPGPGGDRRPAPRRVQARMRPIPSSVMSTCCAQASTSVPSVSTRSSGVSGAS